MSEIAWAAGFFDGEGCVSLNHGRPVLSVSQCGTTEHLERFARALDIGHVLGPYPPRDGRRQVMYRWQVYGPKADAAMTLLRPFLCSPKVTKYDRIRGGDSSEFPERA